MPLLSKAIHKLGRVLPELDTLRCFGVPRGFALFAQLSKIAVEAAEQATLTLPHIVGAEVPKEFVEGSEVSYPDEQICFVEKGMISPDGHTFTEQRRLVAELSPALSQDEVDAGVDAPWDHRTFGDLFSFRWKGCSPSVQTLPYTVVPLLHPQSHDYFTWLLHLLPRLLLIQQQGCQFDRILISGYDQPYLDLLSFLGIGKEQLVTTGRAKFSVAKSIATSVPYRFTGVPRWVCHAIRNYFLSKVPRLLGGKFQRVLLISADDLASEVVNASTVNRIVTGYGFTVINKDKLSFAEQVQLFHNAEVIVALHSSSLANLVFCQPNTKVIEVFSKGKVSTQHWEIANHVGLDYSCLQAEQEEGGVRISPATLEKTLLFAGLEKKKRKRRVLAKQ